MIDVLASNSLGLNLVFSDKQICSADAPTLNMTKDIEVLGIIKHRNRKKNI